MTFNKDRAHIVRFAVSWRIYSYLSRKKETQIYLPLHTLPAVIEPDEKELSLFLVLPIDVFDLLDLLCSIMFPHPAVLLANILYTSDSFTCAPNGNQSFQF